VDALPSGGVVQKRASATSDALNSFPLGHYANVFSVSQALPSLLPAVHTLLLMVSAGIEITTKGNLLQGCTKNYSATGWNTGAMCSNPQEPAASCSSQRKMPRPRSGSPEFHMDNL
jgi:hypothetical protein